MTAPVQMLVETCYSANLNAASTTSRKTIMKLGGQLDLSGLRAALNIEASGGQWHLYDPQVHSSVTDDEVNAVYEEMMSFTTVGETPEDPGMLRLLVDAAAWLHGEKSRSLGWRIIGVNPSKGRKLLNGEQGVISWQLWMTAIHLGLGFTTLAPEDYDSPRCAQ